MPPVPLFGTRAGGTRSRVPRNHARHDEIGGEVLSGHPLMRASQRPSTAPHRRRQKPKVPRETGTASLLQLHRAAQLTAVPGRAARTAAPPVRPDQCGFCESPEVALVPRCGFCGSGQMEPMPRMVPLARTLLRHDPGLSADELVTRLLQHATRKRFELVRDEDPVEREQMLSRASVRLLMGVVGSYRGTVARMVLHAWHAVAHERHKRRGRTRTTETIHDVLFAWERLVSGLLAGQAQDQDEDQDRDHDHDQHQQQQPKSILPDLVEELEGLANGDTDVEEADRDRDQAGKADAPDVSRAKRLFTYEPEHLLDLLRDRRGLMIKVLQDGHLMVAETLEEHPDLPFLFLPLLTPGSCLDVDMLPRSAVPPQHVLLRVHNMSNLGEQGDQIFDHVVSQFSLLAEVRQQLGDVVGCSTFVMFLGRRRVHHESDTDTLEYALPPRTHAANVLLIDNTMLHHLVQLPDDMRAWIHPNLSCLFHIHLDASDGAQDSESSDDEDGGGAGTDDDDGAAAAHLKFERELTRVLMRTRLLQTKQDVMDSDAVASNDELEPHVREAARQVALEVARQTAQNLPANATPAQAAAAVARLARAGGGGGGAGGGGDSEPARVVFDAAQQFLDTGAAAAGTAACLAANEMTSEMLAIVMATRDAAVEAGAAEDDAADAADAASEALAQFERNTSPLPATASRVALMDDGASLDELKQSAQDEMAALERRRQQLSTWISNIESKPAASAPAKAALPPALVTTALAPVGGGGGSPARSRSGSVSGEGSDEVAPISPSSHATRGSFVRRSSVMPGKRRSTAFSTSGPPMPFSPAHSVAENSELQVEQLSLRVHELESKLASSEAAAAAAAAAAQEAQEAQEAAPAKSSPKRRKKRRGGRRRGRRNSMELVPPTGGDGEGDDDEEEPPAEISERMTPASPPQRRLNKAKSMKRRVYKLPKVFDAMWSAPKPNLTGKALLSKQLVHKTIRTIYMAKLASEAAGTAQTLAEATYDHFMQMHGLRKLGEGHLIKFIDSLVRLRDESLGARRCGWFLGLWGDSAAAGSVWPLFSHCVEFCASSTVGPATRATDDQVQLSFVRAKTCAARIFGEVVGPNSDEYKEVLRRMEAMVFTDPGNTSRVDEDEFLDLMLNVYQARAEQAASMLRALFEAGDVNGDGVLTYDEFKALVTHADASVPEPEITQMYRKAHGDGETVEIDNFVRTSLAHGLFTYRKRHLSVSGASLTDSPLGSARRPSLDVTEDLDESRVATMEMLHEVWADSEAQIDEAIRAQSDAYKRAFLEERRSQLMRQMGTGASPEVAWLTYRMLVAETKRDAGAKLRNSVLTVVTSPHGSPAGSPQPGSPLPLPQSQQLPPSSPRMPQSPGWRVVKRLAAGIGMFRAAGKHHHNNRVAAVADDVLVRPRSGTGDAAEFMDALDRASTPRAPSVERDHFRHLSSSSSSSGSASGDEDTDTAGDETDTAGEETGDETGGEGDELVEF